MYQFDNWQQNHYRMAAHRPSSFKPSGFVPFVHERDHLGRIIRKNQQQAAMDGHILKMKLMQTRSSEVQSPQKRTRVTMSSKAQRAHIVKDDCIDHNVEKFFKFKDRVDDASKKNRILKRCTIQLDHPTLIHTEADSCPPLLFQKTVSCSLGSSPAKQSSTIRSPHNKSSSRIATSQFKIKPEPSPMKVKQGRSKSTARPIKSESQDNLKASVGKSYFKFNKNYPQLARFHQMKALSLHFFDDFQENHNKFLKKIRQSKMLSYKLQLQLENQL